MRPINITIFCAVLAIALTGNIREQHEFNPLDSMNPMQTLQLLSGDWTAVLPESIRGIAKSLLGKQKQQGPMGMLSKAQSLLGGNGASSTLGGLLGGLTGGSKDTTNAAGTGSSASSAISGITSFFGKNSDGAKDGAKSGLGGLGDIAGKLFSHEKQIQ